ncbi:MAG TPA: hypothetical protein VMV37_01735 [Gammaproteobacteria bacterium]|nr:hypothetical protein [Gammaproteobacteria bacterium]
MNRANPLIQALSLVAAAALLVLAFLVGAILIGVLLAVGVVAALALAARSWWLQRRISAGAAGKAPGGAPGQVIEGEYTVTGETDGKVGGDRSLPRDDAQRRSSDPRD